MADADKGKFEAQFTLAIVLVGVVFYSLAVLVPIKY